MKPKTLRIIFAAIAGFLLLIGSTCIQQIHIPYPEGDMNASVSITNIVPPWGDHTKFPKPETGEYQINKYYAFGLYKTSEKQYVTKQ
jgi:hypothetical protein